MTDTFTSGKLQISQSVSRISRALKIYSNAFNDTILMKFLPWVRVLNSDQRASSVPSHQSPNSKEAGKQRGSSTNFENSNDASRRQEYVIHL